MRLALYNYDLNLLGDRTLKQWPQDSNVLEPSTENRIQLHDLFIVWKLIVSDQFLILNHKIIV